MREPNFMMPKRSPARTCSPTCDARQTTRRARMPTTWRATTIWPLPRSIHTSLRSLTRRGFVAVRGQELARRVADAGHASPTPGMRFTCTSIGDRKMLICFHSPGGATPGSRRADELHLTVGRRQHRRVASSGDVRSGSRKKNAKKAPSATNGSANAQPT